MEPNYKVADMLSTPKEMCLDCMDWYEGDDCTYPLCVNSHIYDCHQYLFGKIDKCPHCFKY